MNFLKEKVKKYQENKLLEVKQKLQSYTKTKSKLEEELKLADEDEVFEIKKDIEKQKEFIEIWKKNVSEINKQITKLKS